MECVNRLVCVACLKLTDRTRWRRGSPSRFEGIRRFRFSLGLQISKTTVNVSGTRRDRVAHMLRRHLTSPVYAGDEDGFSFMSFDDGFADHGDAFSTGDFLLFSSSEGEEADVEVLINPASADVDYHRSKTTDLSDLNGLANIRVKPIPARTYVGLLSNLGLIIFLVGIVLLHDLHAWRIVRRPLAPFLLTYPFLVSAALASFLGFFCIPLFRTLKIHQILRLEGHGLHLYKKGTPTLGGLFFIPVGVLVAGSMSCFSSAQFIGVAAVTLSFAAIGFTDDLYNLLENSNHGLPAWIRIILEVAAGACFSLWLNSIKITSPYSMKFLIPLPPPLGLLFIGKHYMFLTTFCFVSMANGVNLTDGLDGLAGGVAALSLIGMSIAVLPICSDLSVFGASMAGACVGFLMHNRYKASIFMGDTGSLALGAALAAMASYSGMFFPLFLSSAVFVVEVLSVIIQLSFFRITKRLYGAGRKLFRLAPIHQHFELSGFREPSIVMTAYVISGIFALLGGYVGLISA